MSDNEKKWDIYFCGNDSAPANPEQNQNVADIPISRHTINPDPPEDDYSNDYDRDLGDGDQFRNGFSRFFLKRNRRNLKLTITIFLVVLLAAVIAFTVIISKKLDLIDFDDGINYENADATDFGEEEEDLSFMPVHDVTDASSLKDWLKKWAENGVKLRSKNVINCLLCGVDTQEGTSGRTDAMILVSLNKKTDKITLVSFMRDSYTYMNIDGRDRWYKINSAYNWGGPATLVETLENNYKIEIDNYVTVDFDTFPKLINALGGVTLEVQDYEAKYINRTTVHTIESGPNVTLDGWEALVFARIRYSDADGDVSRTRRQRQLVTALMQKAKSASVGQLNNLMNTALPFVQTNYRKSQIFSLGTQALMQNWVSFPMEQVICPLITDSEDGTQKLTGKDSYTSTGYGSSQEFVWVVDYQLDAQRVQKALYGMTNIEIHDYRESPFDFVTGTRVPTTTQSSSGQTNNTDETSALSGLFGGNNGFHLFGNKTETTTVPVDSTPPADKGNSMNSFDDNQSEEPAGDNIFATVQ